MRLFREDGRLLRDDGRSDPDTFLLARPNSTVRTRAAKLREQNDSSAFVDTGDMLTNMSVLDCLAAARGWKGYERPAQERGGTGAKVGLHSESSKR